MKFSKEVPTKTASRTIAPNKEQSTDKPSGEPLSHTNIGFRLLKKAGWKEGKGVGVREQGQIEPLQPKALSQSHAGLGFQTTDNKNEKLLQTRQPEKERIQAHNENTKRDGPTKSKRKKQVLQFEAEDKAGKEIARYVYSAFRDDTPGVGVSETRDVNPLLRKNKKSKLSVQNPLL